MLKTNKIMVEYGRLSAMFLFTFRHYSRPPTISDIEKTFIFAVLLAKQRGQSLMQKQKHVYLFLLLLLFTRCEGRGRLCFYRCS